MPKLHQCNNENCKHQFASPENIKRSGSVAGHKGVVYSSRWVCPRCESEDYQTFEVSYPEYSRIKMKM